MLIFCGLFILVGSFCVWMAIEELDDRQSWLTPLYAGLACLCLIGSVAIFFV